MSAPFGNVVLNQVVTTGILFVVVRLVVVCGLVRSFAMLCCCGDGNVRVAGGAVAGASK